MNEVFFRDNPIQKIPAPGKKCVVTTLSRLDPCTNLCSKPVMMGCFEITHIRVENKDGGHNKITHVKFNGYVHTRESVSAMINAKMASFYINVKGLVSSVGIVRPEWPNPTYLQSHNGEDWNDHLLALPEC